MRYDPWRDLGWLLLRPWVAIPRLVQVLWSLSGLVLAVGGVKEKVLAAHRAGFRHVILPRDNEADLAKLPDEVRRDMSFTLADHLDQVLEVAFDR